MSDLVVNTEDRFSCVGALLVLICNVGKPRIGRKLVLNYNSI